MGPRHGLRMGTAGAATVAAYNSGMPLQVDAVYENGVLRPLQRLDLREHEHVLVSVVKRAAPGRSNLAVEYMDNGKRELARERTTERTTGRRTGARSRGGPEAACQDSRIDGF
jgi:predicted DNA-binding antitoxin AbrB/MazE fold protein